MKLLLSFLIVTSLLTVDIESVAYGKFISIKEAPYFVSLIHPYERNTYICGGSIISEYWIITAGHCIEQGGEVDRPPQFIQAGKSVNLNDSQPILHEIEKILMHGAYFLDHYIPIYDVALIKLKNPIQFDENRQPIKIRKIPPKENDTLIVMGFGTQGDTKGVSDILKQTEVNVISEFRCKRYTGFFTLPNITFCAGNGTTDVCNGDSGGPAVIDGELAGLVSFGPYCTNYKDHEHSPGAYTQLDTFYDWIVKVTGIVF